jgi:hypothetical protein
MNWSACIFSFSVHTALTAVTAPECKNENQASSRFSYPRNISPLYPK